MNKEYTYIDGKVIISDENNCKTQSEYYDNLDKVLVQENLIETMEEKILELEKESALYQKKKRKHYIPSILPFVMIMPVVAIAIVSKIVDSLSIGQNLFTTYMNTEFGSISHGMLIYTIFTILTYAILIPIGTIFELEMYKNYKRSIKEEKGINNELDFLRKQLEKEKETLESLNHEKSRDNENTEFRTVKVDDLQELEALKSCLNLYFDLGYNEKKYYKYYLKGQLDKELQKNYNDFGIQLAKEYIEEKGPSLVLRKNKNDN